MPHLYLADFGLAKQKQENSKLTSVVGTILYSWYVLIKIVIQFKHVDVICIQYSYCVNITTP